MYERRSILRTGGHDFLCEILLLTFVLVGASENIKLQTQLKIVN